MQCHFIDVNKTFFLRQFCDYIMVFSCYDEDDSIMMMYREQRM